MIAYFQVSHIPGRKVVNGNLILNVDAIVEDFYIIGSGIVQSIEKR